MTARTRTVLKTYYNTGDKPTETQFADTIDSFVSLSDTAAQTVTSALEVTGALTNGGAAVETLTHATATFAPKASPTFTGTVTIPEPSNQTDAASKNYVDTAVGSGTAAGLFQDFRLTLTSGTPVTTSDVTGATTIYCTPYKGNRISLYSGTAWVTRATAEFSLALGTLTSGKPYDVFCYDNAGTPTLEFLVWTNDTTRATALTYQNGVLVKTGATTRRYLGTFYTTATTTTEDSLVKRYLWNYYNRISRPMTISDATSTWTYSTAAWRQANGNAANQLDFVVGVQEDAINASLTVSVVNSTSTLRSTFSGIGLDATDGTLFNSTGLNSAVGTQATNVFARGIATLSAGRHYLPWLEYGGGTDTQTWTGGNSYGVKGEIRG